MGKESFESCISYNELQTLSDKEVCEVLEVVDSPPRSEIAKNKTKKELYDGYIDTADLIVIPLDCIDIQDVDQENSKI